MVFLIDTNVWLERLLDQEKSKEVGKFFDSIPSERLFITDFTFHSIALVLSKLNNVEALKHFVRDTFVEGAVTLLHLKPEDMEPLILVMRKFNLTWKENSLGGIAGSKRMKVLEPQIAMDLAWGKNPILEPAIVIHSKNPINGINEINQTDQINQIDQTDQIDQIPLAL